MKEKVIALYESGFSSSPVNLDDETMEVLIKSNYECDCCGKSIFDMYDFPCINDNQEGVLCENCDQDKYWSYCPLCENHYLTHIKPEECVFVISVETVKEYNLNAKPGFYQVLCFPVYYGDCVSGFDDLFYNNISLAMECDINAIMNAKHPTTEHDVNMDYVCHECFTKYTNLNPIYHPQTT